MSGKESGDFDLVVIGGGVNGCAIARDAAGRGLRVALAEQADLAQGTSSASTKLFHGGLRYLEYFKLRLVREALAERETLLAAMPHISWPMRFVLPISPEMRFDTTTPAARLLSLAFPWMRGRRPAWLIRLGLFIYDNLGARHILPATQSVDLGTSAVGKPLKKSFRRGFEYSDCWVDDSRLVVLMARDAALRGARIWTQTKVTALHQEGSLWQVHLEGPGAATAITARAVVNAAGPWAAQVLQDVAHIPATGGVRLVRGSHIVTRKLYDHDKCYFLQGTDGRIIFAIPYEQDFTLIGTTDIDHPALAAGPVCTDAERDYLCQFVSQYFDTPVTAADVIWSYSGLRPLYDDGARSASAATRDYVLTLASGGAAPFLTVYGGKITTHRRLAEAALAKLTPFFGAMGATWTAKAPLPGGAFPHEGAPKLVEDLLRSHPFLTASWALRLIRAYGTEAAEMLGDAKSQNDLGTHFGATLYAAEVRWMVEHEFARSADDILWRRSKLGLHFAPEQVAALETFVAALWNDADLKPKMGV